MLSKAGAKCQAKFPEPMNEIKSGAAMRLKLGI
jgi:hypothetical protein